MVQKWLSSHKSETVRHINFFCLRLGRDRLITGKLAGMKVFSRLDLVKAFFQVPISRQSSLKTTTVTNWGTWRYRRMPMGLKNSPQSFQKLISHVLDGLSQSFAYLDDILVFSKDEKDSSSNNS